MFRKLFKRIKNCSGCRRRRQWIYRRVAKRKLIKRYEYLNEVNKLMESYITKCILDGGSQDHISKRRQELVNKQGEIKETDRLIDFLRNI